MKRQEVVCLYGSFNSAHGGQSNEVLCAPWAAILFKLPDSCVVASREAASNLDEFRAPRYAQGIHVTHLSKLILFADPILAFAPHEPGDLGFVKRLQESQWWDRETLEAHQLTLLAQLLAHATATVPFYRTRAAAVDPDRPLSLEDWRRIAPLTRRDLQQSRDALASNAVPRSHGKTITTTSSGSTSMPVTVITTDLDVRVFGGATLRHFLWHPYDFGGRIVAIRRYKMGEAEYPKGELLPRWADHNVFPFKTGPSAHLNIAASLDQQINWLVRQDPDYLSTYPSNALRLARQCHRRRIVFPHLEHVISVGEVLSPEVREACREAWDVPVIDTYSAQEIGVMALQCPEGDHYHIQAETAMVEVVNEQGQPCASGEIGAVLVTPLFNYAMPLLRYRIGDLAEVGDPCPCGRGLPVLRRILGRERNGFLVAPTGERYFPAFGARGFSRIAPVVQHQFVQKSTEIVEVRLVTERPLLPAEEDALRRHIEAQFPWSFQIGFSYHVEIARNAGGKFEPFISEVGLD